MPADVELLPLPEWAHNDEIVADMATSEVRDAMATYASANVEHHTEALRVEVERLARHGERQHVAYQQAYDRAERLAEALRGLLALPIAEAELRHLDKGIGTATRNAAWLRARAALRDHDQEGKNAT